MWYVLADEQIQFHSQLKASCWTSKQLRTLAIPYLYRILLKDVRRNAQVDQTLRSVAHSTTTYFVNANDVVLTAETLSLSCIYTCLI